MGSSWVSRVGAMSRVTVASSTVETRSRGQFCSMVMVLPSSRGVVTWSPSRSARSMVAGSSAGVSVSWASWLSSAGALSPPRRGLRRLLPRVLVQGAGGQGDLGGEGEAGVEFPEALLGHGEQLGDGLQGVPLLDGVVKGPGGGGQHGLGHLLGGGRLGARGEVLVLDAHLALDVQGAGLGGGVVLLHQVQGLGDHVGVGVDPHQGAVHGEGVHVVQLGDALQDGAGDPGQALDPVLGGQGGGEGEVLGEGHRGGEDLGSPALRLGHGLVIGGRVLEEGQGLALGLHLVAQGAGGCRHRHRQHHPAEAQKGHGSPPGMGGMGFLPLLPPSLPLPPETVKVLFGKESLVHGTIDSFA